MNLQAPGTYSQSAWQSILGQLTDALGRAFNKGQDVRLVNGERFTLKSPDGSEWSITIDNGGTLSQTKL